MSARKSECSDNKELTLERRPALGKSRNERREMFDKKIVLVKTETRGVYADCEFYDSRGRHNR